MHPCLARPVPLMREPVLGNRYGSETEESPVESEADGAVHPYHQISDTAVR